MSTKWVFWFSVAAIIIIWLTHGIPQVTSGKQTGEKSREHPPDHYVVYTQRLPRKAPTSVVIKGSVLEYDKEIPHPGREKTLFETDYDEGINGVWLSNRGTRILAGINTSE